MIVIKFGGHAMKDENGDFAKSVLDAINSGNSVVIVHGGGPQIDAALSAAGVDSEFVGGFRVTTSEVFEIVERVLSKEVGPEVARTLSECGVPAVSISGRTSKTLIAEQLTALVDGSTAQLGYVGRIVEVNPKSIELLLSEGKVPVVSPIATDRNFEYGFNVNADLAAAAIAGEFDAQSLIIMTDVEGIYRAWPDKSSLISSISAKELSVIKSTFEKGMAPKVAACLDAINAGAKAVRIIDGTDPNALALALSGSGGTLVMA